MSRGLPFLLNKNSDGPSELPYAPPSTSQFRAQNNGSGPHFGFREAIGGERLRDIYKSREPRCRCIPLLLWDDIGSENQNADCCYPKSPKPSSAFDL